jgi:LysM repeat protein
MPTTINEKTVEHAVDAEFAYTTLTYTDKTDKLDVYKKANGGSENVRILAHEKNAASGFQATLIEKTDASGSITKTIAIAGTQFEFKDWSANYSIYKGNVPGLQYKALTEFIDGLINGQKITEYFNEKGVGFHFNEMYLLKNTGVVNYLLQVVENDMGKVISLDDNTSFEFVEDNNLTINIDNSVSDTSPSEAIKNLEDVLRIEQINSINAKTTNSITSYTVKSGDTLSAIAETNDISLDDLLSANPNITNPNQINIGDNISLPSITTSTYTVQAGDSISDIADKLGVTTESLIDLNPWLNAENRISENGKYILIKPEETIALPTSDITSSFYINDGGQNQFYFNFAEHTVSQYDYSLGKWNSSTIDQFFDIDLGFAPYTPFLLAA